MLGESSDEDGLTIVQDSDHESMYISQENNGISQEPRMKLKGKKSKISSNQIVKNP